MSPRVLCLIGILLACVTWPAAQSGDLVLTSRLHHLRSGSAREWTSFPPDAEGPGLTLAFDARRNAEEWTLRLRHRDLKQSWRVLLNGTEVARLPPDENDMMTAWAIAPGLVREGTNELRVVGPASGASDDVMVGEIALVGRPRAAALGGSRLEVSVRDRQANRLVPARITITDERGVLMSSASRSDATLAVRPGVVYTGTGQAAIDLPAGRYWIHAGRGFEYSVAAADVTLAPGATVSRSLEIVREVDTSGWAAMDTHIHTFTYSKHGDATLHEQMLALAGEGVELPVSTEHNQRVDFDGPAREAGVREFFTPLVGSEVTTSVGHFNVWPLEPDGPAIATRVADWTALEQALAAAAPGAVVILNHGRDLHSKFRPLDPSRHVSLSGERLDGQPLPATAMEVINSGAVLTSPLELVEDWMGLLNRGHRLSPVGGSDAHDVSRLFVGQARTYVRVPDDAPGRLDVAGAADSVRRGAVLVSYGLLAEVRVGEAGPGDLTSVGAGDLPVRVHVQGPSWSRAERVHLFVNGVLARTVDIATGSRAGTKWAGELRVPRPRGDVFVTAVAVGPGVEAPFWPMAKPYQPTSIEFTASSLAVSGAVFVDVDGNGQFESARAQAERIVADSRTLEEMGARLAGVDPAVAVQAASLVRARDPAGFAAAVERLASGVPPAVASALRRYLETVSR